MSKWTKLSADWRSMESAWNFHGRRVGGANFTCVDVGQRQLGPLSRQQKEIRTISIGQTGVWLQI